MGSSIDAALLVTAGLFAALCGANDGGPLLVTSLKMTSLRPLTVAMALACMVAVVPALITTQVAETLTDRLVSFEGSDGRVAVIVAVVGAVGVVVAMSAWRVPTSLTLALIGGLVGAGVGGGLPINRSWVLLVLVLAALAPLVGMAAAYLVSRLWGWARFPMRIGSQVRNAHRLGVVAQSFAYGANDGQKMLAVAILAWPAGRAGPSLEFPLWLPAAVSGLFFLGMLIGVRRYTQRLATGVLAVTPVHAATAQLSAAVAVTGSALAGAPVSTTQALTGALVGSGLTEGAGHIRWRQAMAIVGAWVLTVPIAGVIAAAAGALVTR